MSRGKGRKGQGPPQHEMQVVVTTRTTFLNVVVTGVHRMEDGGRIITWIDPAAGIAYELPLPAEMAREVGNQLFSAVPIATPGEMPPSQEAA